jgi:uncharacterized phiE125 gp8 family phage protein
MIDVEAGEPPVSLAEAQAYLRVETGEEEALLAGLLRTATAMCEQFTGRLLVARGFIETLRAGSEWVKLGVTPVRSIDAIGTVGEDGAVTPLAVGDYAIDIDANGDGWVRLTGGGEATVRVEGRAGMAAEGNGVPEPLRQGIVRLAAHLFNARDGSGGEPPAAVTALWRPYRRMRLAPLLGHPNQSNRGWPA